MQLIFMQIQDRILQGQDYYPTTQLCPSENPNFTGQLPSCWNKKFTVQHNSLKQESYLQCPSYNLKHAGLSTEVIST